MLQLSLAILTLCTAAFLYFRGRIGISLLFLGVFYGLSLWVATEVFFPQHRIIFFLLAGTFVCFPLSLLVAFFMDVRYGWFCFDMSYSWAFVWGFAFIFLGINLAGKAVSLFLG
ncbi:MAG: hypothetical protein ACK4WF_02580 [Candidatus Brocadiales bacterium]